MERATPVYAGCHQNTNSGQKFSIFENCASTGNAHGHRHTRVATPTSARGFVFRWHQLYAPLPFISFFKETTHTQQKKWSGKPDRIARAHCRAVQCKHAPHTLILRKPGRSHHFHVPAYPRPSHSAWAENIAYAWLPYTNIWGNFKVP